VTLACLLITLALGLGFLVVEGIEYHDDLRQGFVPGAAFPLVDPPTQLFWALYWIMIGIHALHLTAGILVVAVVAVLFWRRVIPVQDSTMEGVATYWDFVDAVWLVALSAALSGWAPMNARVPSHWDLAKGPLAVWLGLLVLLAISVASAYMPLGGFNAALNLLIAAVMIFLLAAYLMNLRWSNALVRVIAASGLLWLVFMLVLTFTDYFSR
jgi:caa(3)-type oxidase subunit IV